MKLIVLSSSESSKQQKNPALQKLYEQPADEASIVTQMFENGLGAFHYRKSGFSTGQTEEYLNKIPAKFHNKIILHSHHHLVTKFKVKGIHLRDHKNKLLKTWIKLKWLKYKHKTLQMTTSFGRPSSLLEKDNFSYEYVFLNQIFDVLTGNFSSGIQESVVKSVLKQTHHKVIARGGVSVEKIEQAKNMGFSGIAVYSLIWQKPDPLAEFVRFKEKFLELGIPLE